MIFKSYDNTLVQTYAIPLMTKSTESDFGVLRDIHGLIVGLEHKLDPIFRNKLLTVSAYTSFRKNINFFKSRNYHEIICEQYVLSNFGKSNRIKTV